MKIIDRLAEPGQMLAQNANAHRVDRLPASYDETARRRRPAF